MPDYTELVKALRVCGDSNKSCKDCPVENCPGYGEWEFAAEALMINAADAIEELLKSARAMHTWIFLNTGDEQKAYDECGLSDEMNAMLGYGGQFEFRAEPPKEETE